ncbi:MAG: acyltransferase [Rhodospirillaceae bacterium]|nr:acyltransferase [Rhodospirillaceae bacterium]MBT6404251.1 acyltransferase [Rhodospirillaceae bacterium]MBT6534586.1 acyltransferase [Rhodospirillaceae bacterium]MBT7361172.1 acyltransferase [Rhodospirillaceae bacterium]
MASSRNDDLDALRGIAVCLVVSTHFCWVFFPNLVIGNFHAIDSLSAISPFPLSNLLFPNVLAVTVLLAVSGYAGVIAFAARTAHRTLAFDIGHRYLRLVLPALAAGGIAYALSLLFNNAHLSASKIIYGPIEWTWLTLFWSEPPTITALAAEFLLGQVEQNSAILPVLWMMPDLFMGSVAVLLGMRYVPAKHCAWAFLIAGIALLALRPLTGAVILGAGVGLWQQSRPAVRIPVGIRLSVLILALLIGLNPIGSGTGGLTLLVWYAPWLPAAFALPATAVAGVLILLALLPRRSIDASRHRLLAAVGRRSYGVYLLHLPVLLTISSAIFVSLHGAHGQMPAMIATTFVTLATLVIMVVLFDRLIEKPVTRLIRA